MQLNRYTCCSVHRDMILMFDLCKILEQNLFKPLSTLYSTFCFNLPALSGCGFFFIPVNDQGWYFHPCFNQKSVDEKINKFIIKWIPGGVLFVSVIETWFADHNQPLILFGNRSQRPSQPSKSHKRPDVQMKETLFFSMYVLKKSNFSWSSNETVSMQ